MSKMAAEIEDLQMMLSDSTQEQVILSKQCYNKDLKI